ncbi:MAG: hypothetical protein Q7K43_04780, partial [Candidatus Woesearchaeota archaeon]|nr:hypothetical protein [Candidatus Woesearchaeota archaeon]
MKVKLLYTLVFLLVFSITPTTTNAQNATRASDLKTERQNGISQIRERTKAEMQALRVQFKERVQTIKDTRKQGVTQKLDADIARANLKHTTKFNEVLARLQRMLDKIAPDAKDPKTLSDIKSAQAKIDLAKVAVANQAAKEYTIEITDETTLRKNVGTTISQFRQDLMQVHKLVIDARQAVQVLRTDKVMIKKE